MFGCLSGAFKRTAVVPFRAPAPALSARPSVASAAAAADRLRSEMELLRVLSLLPRVTQSETLSHIRAVSAACSGVGLVVDVQAVVLSCLLSPEHRFAACELPLHIVSHGRGVRPSRLVDWPTVGLLRTATALYTVSEGGGDVALALPPSVYDLRVRLEAGERARSAILVFECRFGAAQRAAQRATGRNGVLVVRVDAAAEVVRVWADFPVPPQIAWATEDKLRDPLLDHRFSVALTFTAAETDDGKAPTKVDANASGHDRVGDGGDGGGAADALHAVRFVDPVRAHARSLALIRSVSFSPERFSVIRAREAARPAYGMLDESMFEDIHEILE